MIKLVFPERSPPRRQSAPVPKLPSPDLASKIVKQVSGYDEDVIDVVRRVDLNSDSFVSVGEVAQVRRDPAAYGLRPRHDEALQKVSQLIPSPQVEPSAAERDDSLYKVRVRRLADYESEKVTHDAAAKMTEPRFPATVFSDHERYWAEYLLKNYPSDDGTLTWTYLKKFEKHKDQCARTEALPVVKAAFLEQRQRFERAGKHLPHVIVPDDTAESRVVPLGLPFDVIVDSELKSSRTQTELCHRFSFGSIPEGTTVVVDGGRRNHKGYGFTSDYPIRKIDDLGDGKLSIYKDGKLVQERAVDVETLRKILPSDERVDLSEIGTRTRIVTASGRLVSEPPNSWLDRGLRRFDGDLDVSSTGHTDRRRSIETNFVFAFSAASMAGAGAMLGASFNIPIVGWVLAPLLFPAVKDAMDIVLHSVAAGIDSLDDN